MTDLDKACHGELRVVGEWARDDFGYHKADESHRHQRGQEDRHAHLNTIRIERSWLRSLLEVFNGFFDGSQTAFDPRKIDAGMIELGLGGGC